MVQVAMVHHLGSVISRTLAQAVNVWTMSLQPALFAVPPQATVMLLKNVME
jgi:hypothetical protein